MAKLLKTMGFHQRAELLLYEAMSYSTSPYEAHVQVIDLNLIFTMILYLSIALHCTAFILILIL